MGRTLAGTGDLKVLSLSASLVSTEPSGLRPDSSWRNNSEYQSSLMLPPPRVSHLLPKSDPRNPSLPVGLPVYVCVFTPNSRFACFHTQDSRVHQPLSPCYARADSRANLHSLPPLLEQTLVALEHRRRQETPDSAAAALAAETWTLETPSGALRISRNPSISSASHTPEPVQQVSRGHVFGASLHPRRVQRAFSEPPAEISSYGHAG